MSNFGQRELEARIYELARSLENVLDLYNNFAGTYYTTEVLDENDNVVLHQVPDATAEVLDLASEVLWGEEMELYS